jgi:hypothetical protein
VESGSCVDHTLANCSRRETKPLKSRFIQQSEIVKIGHLAFAGYPAGLSDELP